MRSRFLVAGVFILIFFGSNSTAIPCNKNVKKQGENFFRVEKNISPPHPAFIQFAKFVSVFGVKIYAMADVRDFKLLHAANVLAQYLDNDEDGNIDNLRILEAMLANKAFVIMVKTEGSPDLKKFFKARPPRNMIGQDLYDEETRPNGAEMGQFDASLEEILHIVTHAGWAHAYPEIFAEKKGTAVAKAMDLARGGCFEKVPKRYPEKAWYSYYDETCEYDCQVAEYVYWALTSILGGQDFPGRLEEIENEWKLNTREKVKKGDPAIYKLLIDVRYKLPTVLPDGTYRM